MHAVFSHPLELSIIEANFHELEPWLVAFVASVITLYIFRRYGRKITPKDNKTADLVLDLVILFTAGSLIASISATPLMSSIIASINRNISSWVIDGIRIGDFATIAGGVILTIVVGVLGYFYTKSESGWTLLWFGLSLQVAAVFAPWINTILSWWINYVIAHVWNFVLWLVTVVPNTQVHF